MGLIRKTLAVGTVGVVRPNSKKQRNQKELIKQQKVANQLAAAQLQAQRQMQEQLLRAQQHAVYLQAQQPSHPISGPTEHQLNAPPAVSAARPGWFSDPFGGDGLRWHDGLNWTDHTAPRP